MDGAAFLDQSHAIMDAVGRRGAGRCDGSFSAEHGVGQLKPYMMESWRGGAELSAMQKIKAALDPLRLMNPGKVPALASWPCRNGQRRRFGARLAPAPDPSVMCPEAEGPKPMSDIAPDPRRWLALAVLLAGTFLPAFDFFVVNVALPSLQAELGARPAQLEFVVAGYALGFALLLVTGGRLGDLYGRKRMFMLGMAGFTVASALCGLAPTPGILIAARVLQGAHRGGDEPAGAGDHPRHLPGARAGARHRLFRHHAGAGLDRGAAGRRGADRGRHRRAELAPDLPGQRADRGGGAGRGGVAAARLARDRPPRRSIWAASPSARWRCCC